VRPAHRDNLLSEARAEEWLLIEWPEDETEPTKYWFSTLPEGTAFDRLVDLTKLRWRIERDYQELKQELGLGDYEGRGWRGFHHHATLCIAAYGFLIAERGALPPSGPHFSSQISGSAIPQSYRPRGAADPTRTPHPKLDRDYATTPRCRSHQHPPEMSLLQYADPQKGQTP
jgi:SRSO17 transposase